MRGRLVACAGLAGLLLALAVPVAASAHVTMDRAFDGTLLYAKRTCDRDSWCKQYGADGCYRFPGGASCAAWLYQQNQRDGRYSCKRRLSWTVPHHFNFLTRWNCKYRGWDWGPPLKRATAD